MNPLRRSRALAALSAPCLASALVSSQLFAQSDVVPAQPQSRPVAIVNAVVHTATADTPLIANGHVLFDGGRIVSVGAGMPALPPNCEIVDAQGMHLSPGFCAFPTTSASSRRSRSNRPTTAASSASSDPRPCLRSRSIRTATS